MIVTAELSLYPLASDYEASIIQFIQTLKSQTTIQVKTHAMSTYVKGESAEVFEALHVALSDVNANNETLSLIIKMINRDLPVEKGFLNFESS